MTDNCKRGYAFYTESGQEKSMNLTFSEDKKLEKLNMQFQEKACKDGMNGLQSQKTHH